MSACELEKLGCDCAASTQQLLRSITKQTWMIVLCLLCNETGPPNNKGRRCKEVSPPDSRTEELSSIEATSGKKERPTHSLPVPTAASNTTPFESQPNKDPKGKGKSLKKRYASLRIMRVNLAQSPC